METAVWDDFYSRIEEIGVLPVAVIDDAELALPLSDALREGGLPAIEVAFRADSAADAIRRIARSDGDFFVGAGTVLSCAQVDEALDAGARFIVAPGFDEAVVRHCIARNVPVIPGTVTPTEVTAARKLGITHSKFFPAELFGGVEAIAALAAPFVGHKFMPTGGVNVDNLSSYLSSVHVFGCGGTWMVKNDLVSEGDFDEVARLCSEAVSIVQSVRK